MGATVTTGKLASAFKDTNGKVHYVLFEETYEKNCTPHEPHWGCISIGPIEVTMRKVFGKASACEGGSLQNRNGHITPEGYIAGWLSEMADSVEFNSDRTIQLQVSDGFNSTIPIWKVEGAKKTLSDLGREDIINALLKGESVGLSLVENADLIAALCRNDIAPWRIIDHVPLYSLRNKDLGYAKAKPAKPINISVPSVLRVWDEELLLQRPDGAWQCAGWSYRVMGDLIAKAYEAELREPGSYRKRIKAYREAVESAPKLPQGMTAKIDLTVPVESRYEKELLAKFGNKHSVTKTVTGFEITVRDENELVSDLCGLPIACTTWHQPQQAPAAGLQGSLLI